MKWILYGEDLEGLTKAAKAAAEYAAESGVPSHRMLGLRIEGRFYAAFWNKDSIRVQENP